MPYAYYNKIFVLSDSAALYSITHSDTVYIVPLPQWAKHMAPPGGATSQGLDRPKTV